MTHCSCTSGCTVARGLCKHQRRRCTSACHPSRTCSLQSTTLSKPSTTLDVDRTRVKSPKAPTWISLGNGNELLIEDKWLIESGKWPNDRIISGWEFLLQQKYPGVRGLHPLRLGESSSKIHTNVKSCRFLIVEQPLGCVVNCWMFCWCCAVAGPHCGPSSSQQQMIISECPKDSIQIEMLNVQLQSGGSECGMFA